MNIFKKIKLYFYYKKFLNKNIKEISFKLNNISKNSNYFYIPEIRKDYLYRFYTVINFNETLEKEFNIYGNSYAIEQVLKVVNIMKNELSKYTFYEYIKLQNIKKITNNSYLVVFSFRFLNLKMLFIVKYILLLLLAIGLLFFII